MKTLIIAEKPSVANDIAKVLKCNKSGNGYKSNDNYVVTWAVGHLISLQDPDDIDKKYKKWQLKDLPILPDIIPLKIIHSSKTQYAIVNNLINSKDIKDIICATDAGREGELIFRLIYKYSNCQKPFKRLWINSLTDESIKKGFANLKDGKDYDPLYYSALCRAYADWYIGMNASRYYSLKYNSILSVGRVQTPTLSLIVDKYKEIKNFIPQDYYIINAEFENLSGTWFDINNTNFKENKKIPSKEIAKQIVIECKGKTATVKSSENTESSEYPPLLFDLTSLQKEANSLFSYTAKKTLSIAQELYEKFKIITYPRTDSKYLSNDIKPSIKHLIQNLPQEYDKYKLKAIEGFEKNIASRCFNNEKLSDHHAIIPTNKKANLNSLNTDQLNIYKLILYRFLCVFFDKAIYNNQKIILQIDKHHFIANGKSIIQKGFKEIEFNLGKKKSSKDKFLPNLNIGDKEKLKTCKIKNEVTKPPEKYTDASLLSAMENAGRFVEDDELKQSLKNNGLGTPATRAAIIERLIKVGYIKRSGKYLEAEEKGINLISVVENILRSPELTGAWELQLNEIAEDKNKFSDKATNFLIDIKKLSRSIMCNNEQKSPVIFTSDFKKSKSNKNSLNIKCPYCTKGDVLENSKAFYCSSWKNGCKFTVWKNSLVKNGGPIIDKKLMQLILEKREVVGSTGKIIFENNKINFYKN